MIKASMLLIFLCSIVSATEVQTAEKKELLIASINAHNLFDTEKDEGKDDWTYLSKNTPGKAEYCETIKNSYYRKSCKETNWNERRLKRKLISLRKLIKKGFERKPDIIALQEVENENVVKMLADFVGYDYHYVTDSADRRGIDVAILMNKVEGVEILNSIEHEVKGDFLVKPTRNVLELTLQVGEKKLSVFSNHWPSQAAPGKVRVGVAKLVMEVVKERLQDPNHHVVLTGDFNTIDNDHPHPFKDVLEVGDNALINIYEKFKRDRSISWDIKDQMPLGTYFYARNMEWNVLDNFFVSKNLMDKEGIDIELSSFRIIAPKFARTTYTYDQKKNDPKYGTTIMGVPKRYNHKIGFKILDSGYSDHFPVQLKVKF